MLGRSKFMIIALLLMFSIFHGCKSNDEMEQQIPGHDTSELRGAIDIYDSRRMEEGKSEWFDA